MDIHLISPTLTTPPMMINRPIKKKGVTHSASLTFVKHGAGNGIENIPLIDHSSYLPGLIEDRQALDTMLDHQVDTLHEGVILLNRHHLPAHVRCDLFIPRLLCQ